MNKNAFNFKLLDTAFLSFFADTLQNSDPRLTFLMRWVNFLSSVVEVSSSGKGMVFESTDISKVRALSSFGLPFRYAARNTLFTAETDPANLHIFVEFSPLELSAFFLRLFSCACFQD